MLNLNIQCGVLTLLIHSFSFFLDIPEQIPTNESYLFKWRVRFQISRLLIGCSDVFIRHSIGWILHSFQSTKYKLKIKLILKLIKRGDQALISIFTILKFSVLSWEFMNVGYRDYCWILSFFLISRLNNRTGLRISHSKVFSSGPPVFCCLFSRETM